MKNSEIKISNARNTAIALVSSTTSGWTWEKAVKVAGEAHGLSSDELKKV